MKKEAYLIIFFLVFSSYIFSGEEVASAKFPTFTIYANKTPIYATLSGSFTFHPENQIEKARVFFKTHDQLNRIGLGSSYLSIKYEDKVYKFNELNNIKSEWNLEEGSISITGEIPAANVEVYFILRNKTNRENSFFISYGATNRSNRIVDIGFRSLLDLSNELNEEIPLRVSLENAHEKEIYTTEYKFTPFQSGYWETQEPNSDSFIGIQNFLTGNGNTPPDKVAFVNWEKAFSSEWKYITNKNISTSQNSAVLVWWNPRPVRHGETLEVSTEYEIKVKKDGILFELLDPKTGSGRLHLKLINNSDRRKDFFYYLKSSNSSFLSLNFDNPLKLTVGKNSILDKIIPVIVHGKGETDLIIKESENNKEKIYRFPVLLSSENRDQSPKFWKSSKYPIIYNSDKDGLKLVGIVRAKDTGKKLGEAELISVKSIQNNYVYLGEVDLHEFSGEVLIEIFRK